MAKKRNSIYIAIALSLGIVTLAGCGKETPGLSEKIGQGVTICESNYCVGEDGILTKEDNIRVCFYEPKSDLYLPLCNKPNCDHQTENCAAVTLAKQSDWIGYHNGKLYYCSSDERRVTKLYSADLDGENVKKLGTYQHELSWGRRIFDGDSLYLATNDDVFADEGDYKGVFTELLRIDLETGKETSVIEAQKALVPGYYLLGIYGDKLYYEDRIEGNRLMERDLTTDRVERLADGVTAASLKEEILFCSLENGEAFEINLEKQEQKHLDIGKAIPAFWNDQIKIVMLDDAEKSGFYLWENEALKEISPFRMDGDLLIVAQYGDYLFGSRKQQFCKVSLEDYLSGSWEAEELRSVSR